MSHAAAPAGHGRSTRIIELNGGPYAHSERSHRSSRPLPLNRVPACPRRCDFRVVLVFPAVSFRRGRRARHGRRPHRLATRAVDGPEWVASTSVVSPPDLHPEPLSIHSLGFASDCQNFRSAGGRRGSVGSWAIVALPPRAEDPASNARGHRGGRGPKRLPGGPGRPATTGLSTHGCVRRTAPSCRAGLRGGRDCFHQIPQWPGVSPRLVPAQAWVRDGVPTQRGSCFSAKRRRSAWSSARSSPLNGDKKSASI